jgi:hypothetical protein
MVKRSARVALLAAMCAIVVSYDVAAQRVK